MIINVRFIVFTLCSLLAMPISGSRHTFKISLTHEIKYSRHSCFKARWRGEISADPCYTNEATNLNEGNP